MTLLIFATVLSGCTTIGAGGFALFEGGADSGAGAGGRERQGLFAGGSGSDAAPLRPTGGSEAGREVAEAALDLVGQRNLTVGGRRFNYDCTGTILAAYYSAGYDLATHFGGYTGNGVSRLYQMADDRGTIRSRAPLRPGDIVFWDNSYDMNGDRRWNDELTHAGIVVNIAGDGTVTYVHHNYRRGVVTATMNPRRPSDRELNSPMRMKSHRWRASDPWLSGELYRAHGALY